MRLNTFAYDFLNVIKPFLLLALLFPATVLAEDFTWSDNGNSTCTVTGYTGAGGNVVIPDKLGDLTVNRIGGNCFAYCNSLTNIHIPDSVVSFGSWAFGSCVNLTSIVIPDNVTKIGAGCFHHCYSLNSVTIGSSVTKIDEEVFYNCNNLTDINIPDGVTSICSSAFEDCESLIHVRTGDNTKGPTMAFWPSDSLSKVMHSAVPNKETSSVLSVSGAKAEIVSAQAVFRSSQDVNKVKVCMTALEHTQSNTKISASAVKLQWVRYIDIAHNTKGISDDELVAKAPAEIPDPYWEDLEIPVKANQAQPVWLEIEVPQKAPAGNYNGKLMLIADGKLAILPIKLHVWDFELPQERHLSVINWWRFPKKYPVKPYSPEYWDLLGEWCRFVVKHRQTDIQTGLNSIKETGDSEQGYSYDTSIVEQFAEIAFQNGIRQIHLGPVGKRKGEWNSGTGKIVPVESRMRRLAAFEKVIVRRNWQDRFLVSIADEPFIQHESSYAAMVDKVHKIAPSVRCIEAIESEYFGNLDIYVPKLNHLACWLPAYERARNSGKELWFYTCCHPLGRYPNRFLDQSLLKTRVLHWINYRYDLKGYLHWALDGFDSDEPYTENGISRNGSLPLGDCTITYPGKKMLLGSLRFSAMRDGLEDYEYLWVLENELAKIKSTLGDDGFWFDARQRPLELCRRVISSFHSYTRDDSVMLDTRRAIAEEIEALKAKPLLIVQTSPPEGTTLYHGPLNVCVRGLTSPGATITINGKVAENITPDGYFAQAHFFSDGKQTITITTELDGKKRTVTRSFEFAKNDL